MATFYVDPVGGNDANAGTSFATRWQSLGSGATAARIAPGDEIRVIASPDATSIGNATWTADSYGVVLPTAVTATVTNATTAWTASANASSATTSVRKIGFAATTISTATAFTTGKVAYFTLLTPLDLSGYQQLSFWIQVFSGSLPLADGDFQLRLCSDTLGDTVVNAFNIPRIQASNQWQAYTIDFGSALGTNIQSISFGATVDRNSVGFVLNNIIACKAPSSNDSLSLTSLISKNTGTEAWYAIQSIDGNNITLDKWPQYNLSSAGTGKGYPGTTATVDTFKREPINLPFAFIGNSSTWGQLNDSGTAGNVITYSGGWNRTDMSTKTGKTYINGVNNTGTGIFTPIGLPRSFLTITDINLFRFGSGVRFVDFSTNITFTADDISYALTGIEGLGGNGTSTWGASNNSFTVTNITQTSTSGISPATLTGSGIGSSVTVTNLSMNWNYGVNAAQTNASKWEFNITNLDNNGLGTTGGGVRVSNSPSAGGGLYFTFNITNSRKSYISVDIAGGLGHVINATGTFSNTGSEGPLFFIRTGVTNVLFNLQGATITRGAGGGAICALGGGSSITSISNITFKGGTWTPTVFAVFDVFSYVDNITVDDATLVSGSWLSVPGNLTLQGIPSFRISRPGGVANNSRYYNSTSLGYWEPSTAVVRTAGGNSWLAVNWNSNNYPDDDYPNEIPVATVAVDSSGLVTASVWAYLTNANNVIKLVCKGGQIAGVPNDVVATSSSGTLNAWQQLTITFTPSAKGAVQIVAQAYGGTTSASYIDDFSVTQA